MHSSTTRLLCAALILTLAGCATMPEVTRVNPDTAAPAGAITYWLPKTVLTASVPLKRTVKKRATLLPADPGFQKEYFKLLEERLGYPRRMVQLGNQATVAIDDEAETLITSRGVRDPAAHFAASLDARVFHDLKLTMEFSGTQIMQSGSVDVTNQTLPTVVKTLTTAAEIAATVASGGAVPLMGHGGDRTPDATAAKSRLPEVDAAIDRVLELRALRKSLYTVSSPHAETAELKMAVAWLDAQEQVQLNKLLGATQETAWTAQLDFAPTATKLTAVLGRVHEAAGFEVVASGNGALCPFPYAAAKPATVTEWIPQIPGDAASAEWKTRAEEVTEITISATGPAAPDDALLGTKGSYVYRVPALAKVSILAGTDTLSESEVAIAQLGQLRQLPRSLGGVHGSYAVTLDGVTGALLKIEAGSTAADTATTIADLGAAAKARIEENTPAKRLEREKDYLTNLQAVQDLRKQLKGDTTPGGDSN